MSCCKPGCAAVGVHVRSKGDGYASTYCSRHYRVDRMIDEARQRGKTTPTRDQLEDLIPADMRCPQCSVTMNWSRADGHATTLTLQHWRDGTLGVLCLSCNTRHRGMPDDAEFKAMPRDHKRCPDCTKVLPADAFGYRRNGNPHSYCKPCLAKRNSSWKLKTP